jgi:ATP-dependent 26S proteasome regulatory subunit
MSCDNFVMQWFGDAEKLTKSLFSLARKLSPAVIFVDEVREMHSF